MALSVVVPTLNGREQLARTLDAVATHAPDAEVVVVNGPSTDGTSGMVRERDDVDVLVETADRTVAAARNAGIERATGDVVALVDQGFSVTDTWVDAIATGLDDADVVTGPIHEQLRGGVTTESVESATVAGREVTFLNGGNAAFRSAALDALDGFDEQLEIGSSRDCAHRLAAMEYDVAWDASMGVERAVGTDGGVRRTDEALKYRSLAYRLVKNYGPRPRVAARLVGQPGRNALTALRSVLGGDERPSDWLTTGRDVVRGLAVGAKDGLRARLLDRSTRRNPYGRSARADRAVAVYDRR